MEFVVTEILNAIKENNINAELIKGKAYEDFFKSVCTKFIGANSGYPIWELLTDKVSTQDKNGWTLIADFINGNSSILFLEKRKADFAVMLKSGSDVQLLLENTFHFVFYITNPTLDYLLCFNDHDFVIASGTAKMWLQSLKK